MSPLGAFLELRENLREKFRSSKKKISKNEV